mgnify:FL=1
MGSSFSLVMHEQANSLGFTAVRNGREQSPQVVTLQVRKFPSNSIYKEEHNSLEVSWPKRLELLLIVD